MKIEMFRKKRNVGETEMFGENTNVGGKHKCLGKAEMLSDDAKPTQR
jgi:hypothetical protein